MRKARLRRADLLQLGAVCLLAAFVYTGMAQLGRAGDCTPHQIDGQCGMSTFFGQVYGAVGAVVIVVAGLSIVWLRSARRARRESQWTRDR